MSIQLFVALLGVLIASAAPSTAWGVYLASRIERVADRLDDRMRAVEAGQREVVAGLEAARREVRAHAAATPREAHGRATP